MLKSEYNLKSIARRCTQEITNMNTLPQELLIMILRHTDDKSCQAISQVSLEYRWILNEEKLWTSFGDNYYGYMLVLSKKLGVRPKTIRWNIKKMYGYFGMITPLSKIIHLYKDGQFTNQRINRATVYHYPKCGCRNKISYDTYKIRWLKDGIYELEGVRILIKDGRLYGKLLIKISTEYKPYRRLNLDYNHNEPYDLTIYGGDIGTIDIGIINIDVSTLHACEIGESFTNNLLQVE